MPCIFIRLNRESDGIFNGERLSGMAAWWVGLGYRRMIILRESWMCLFRSVPIFQNPPIIFYSQDDPFLAQLGIPQIFILVKTASQTHDKLPVASKSYLSTYFYPQANSPKQFSNNIPLI
jgi:hypothetical protein